MTISEIQKEIIKLKKEKDICILAHCYQAREILEIADFTGDSYKLSVDATKVKNKNIIMCGVKFMAETCKILSPEKHIYMPNTNAGCPMAEQMNKQTILDIKKEHPEYTVVAYINTTAELKTVCDVCVTSASAVKICKKIDNDNILFIPDCNLGNFVASQIPEKNFKLLSGGCPIHANVNTEDVIKAKKMYPDAKLLVHPECVPEITKMADYAGSTTGIMDYAINSDEKEFIIGTEISIAEHLQYMCPDKTFHQLSLKLICPDMKATTLMDVYNCITSPAGREIFLDDKTITDAKKCIDEMIRLG